VCLSLIDPFGVIFSLLIIGTPIIQPVVTGLSDGSFNDSYLPIFPFLFVLPSLSLGAKRFIFNYSNLKLFSDVIRCTLAMLAFTLLMDGYLSRNLFNIPSISSMFEPLGIGASTSSKSFVGYLLYVFPSMIKFTFSLALVVGLVIFSYFQDPLNEKIQTSNLLSSNLSKVVDWFAGISFRSMSLGVVEFKEPHKKLCVEDLKQIKIHEAEFFMGCNVVKSQPVPVRICQIGDTYYTAFHLTKAMPITVSDEEGKQSARLPYI
jgi:hypothetical protein